MKLEVAKFVKITSAALLGCVAIAGAEGFGVSSDLPVKICTGDFVTFCRSVEYPALGIFLLATGLIVAFWLLRWSGNRSGVQSGASEF